MYYYYSQSHYTKSGMLCRKQKGRMEIFIFRQFNTHFDEKELIHLLDKKLNRKTVSRGPLKQKAAEHPELQ